MVPEWINHFENEIQIIGLGAAGSFWEGKPGFGGKLK